MAGGGNNNNNGDKNGDDVGDNGDDGHTLWIPNGDDVGDNGDDGHTLWIPSHPFWMIWVPTLLHFAAVEFLWCSVIPAHGRSHCDTRRPHTFFLDDR